MCIIHVITKEVCIVLIYVTVVVSHGLLHFLGITVGDIGAKFSTLMNGGDNGYLMFNHVRIPLNQMLMGLAKVQQSS